MFARLLPASLFAACACVPVDQLPESAGSDRDLHSSEIVRFSEECKKWDEWDKPAKPFRVHANTYYVGTCGIAAILITNDEGHILIDTGTQNGADVVAENIRSLGFDLSDVRYLTHSHEHFDHVGGFAKVQALTGAVIIGNSASIPVLLSGVPGELDPQHGTHPSFPPILAPPASAGWNKIGNGESISVGDVEVFAIETPGHSPGAFSWHWQACDGDNCKTIVYADSLSPISSDEHRFSDHPTDLALFREGLGRIAALDCDILLTPHPSHSLMVERAATGTFDGGISCAQYASGKMNDLDARLQREAEGDQ
ncbi:MAG: subclass B3 metallo-beta-lactamase [Erythrobacter sp.]|uniref:subclass B3 metallo-beta-lactamase n=1 Tax=Erythrobacter sp. TaxID=1042 RepID=UPI003262E2CE